MSDSHPNTVPALDLAGITGGTPLPGWSIAESRVEVDREFLVDACAAVIAARPRARLATMIGLDDRVAAGSFRLVYTFAMPDRTWATIETQLPAGNPVFQSVSIAVPAAQWYEREVQDMLGVVAEGHPDPRRLIHRDDWPNGLYPLRKDFDPSINIERVPHEPTVFHHRHGEGIVEIPVGPIHAGVIEPGHFRFAAVGERILHLEAQLFYTHRGIEKLAEGKSASQVLQIAERTCGVCAFSHAVSYCQAVEAIAGATVPDRARALRTIFLELERLYNHIGDLGNICAGVSFAVGASIGARIKDDLQRLNERLTGNRFLRGTSTIGGLRRDLDGQALSDIETTIVRIAKEFGDFIALMLGTDTAVERLRGTGILPQATARALGAVGVAARASGVDIDSRRDHPHAFYPDAPQPVAVPARTAGDAEARALIRMDETIVSFAMIRSILANMPGGPVITPIGPIPENRVGFAVTESPRGENLHWVRTGPAGTIDRLRIRSASFPNWPTVAASVPGNMVPDFPVINKSFELCYACLDR